MPGCTGHKKDPISFEAGLAPSSSPAALYHLCFHHNRRTDSKKSTLPRQSALRVVLFWLVGAESGSLLRLGLCCERLAALDDEVDGKDDKQDGQDRADVAPGKAGARRR